MFHNFAKMVQNVGSCWLLMAPITYTFIHIIRFISIATEET